jgi:hypothetical protein
MEGRQIIRRNRTKQSKSLQERLLSMARDAREAAGVLPPGEEQARLLQSALDTEAAAAIDRWLASPGLRSPK